MTISIFSCCKKYDTARPEDDNSIADNNEEAIKVAKEENCRTRECLSEVIEKLESIMPQKRRFLGTARYGQYIASAQNAVNDLQNFSNQLATCADYANLNDQNNSIQQKIIEKLGSYQQVLENEKSKTQLKNFSEAFYEDGKNDLDYTVIETKMDNKSNLVSSL